MWNMLIRESGNPPDYALLDDDGRLAEYGISRNGTTSGVGNILLGTVERVLPDVSAAFIRIGQKKNGFLPLQESGAFVAARPLLTGNEEIVQIRRDPRGDKGAMLSRDIILAGQYVLVLPRSHIVGVSKRVEDVSERAICEALGHSISGGRFGIIVRHAALFACSETVQAEANALYSEWIELEKSLIYKKAPCLIRKEVPPVLLCARDYSVRHAICVTSAFAKPDEFPEQIEWRHVSPEELEAFREGYAVDRQISESLRRKVPLKGGGSLIIDEREALQTIDVNSGEAVKSGSDGLSLETNLRAVSEIARQIRLRNLSGIILIDFINMNNDSEREKVTSAMETALQDDRIKSVIHGFTCTGLMEITRRRTGESLSEIMTEECRHCHGSGRCLPERNL